MSDYIEVNSDFRDPSDVGRTGKLYVTVSSQMVLAGGGIVPAGRFEYPVAGSVRIEKPNGSGGVDILPWKLPITEDANPPLSLYFSFVDDYGRKDELGAFVVPRAVGPIDFNTLLPVMED